MSLINEALKKAQRERTGEVPELTSMPSVGGQSAVRIARRAKPAGLNPMLLWLGLGTAGLAVVGVGGFMLFRSKPPATITVNHVVVPEPVPAKPEPAKPTVTTPASTAAAPEASSFTVPTVAASGKIDPPTPKPEAPVQFSPPLQVAATVAEPPPAKVEPARIEPPRLPDTPPKLDSQAINYIESLRVAGIRASTTDSKVLMNDRVYRKGDIVEHQLGLRLVDLTSTSLTFEDERGARYTRIF